jgi:hypothetical protein
MMRGIFRATGQIKVAEEVAERKQRASRERLLRKLSQRCRGDERYGQKLITDKDESADDLLTTRGRE